MRAAACLALCILFPSLTIASGTGTDADDVGRAVAFLAGTQHEDGTFEFYAATMYVEAVAQAGLDPKAWPSRELSAFAELRPYGSDETQVYNSYARIVYASATAGYDPRNVGGVDYLERVRDGFKGAQFGNPTTINDDAWAILALRAAGVPASDPQIQAAVLVLANSQAPDGGWAFSTPALKGFSDITGMALAALRSAGATMGEFASAKTFLDSTYNATSGGHRESSAAGNALCQSSVWALVGYNALGAAESDGTREFVRSLQRADGGFARKAGASETSDIFCTTEVVPLLAGVPHPFPGYVPATIAKPNVPARENATFGLGSAHDRLSLTFRETNVSGSGRTFRFPAAGTYHYDYLAEGPGIRARGSGSIDVRSARPLVGALPAEVTVLRPAPLSLDLGSARDPDGRVVGARIDWGDGNESDGTSHAYMRPGEYLLRARVVDDAGEWSEPATMRVLVPNRAPTIAVPHRVVGDRVAGATIAVVASDPDGDPVEGAGNVAVALDALGDLTREIVVRDAFGAEARANVTVEVVNLPPALAVSFERAEDGIVLVANATDPDGPAPRIAWSVANATHEGARVRVALPPGEHVARAEAVDADGARVNASLTISIAEARMAARLDAEPQYDPAPPAIHAFDASLADGALLATFAADPDTTIVLSWRSDLGESEQVVTSSPAEVPLPGARWATATLTVERAGLVASRATGLLVDAPEPTAPLPEAAQEAAPIVVAAASGAEDASAALDAPLETSAVLPAAQNETPMPPWPALAALVAALALVRRRR